MTSSLIQNAPGLWTPIFDIAPVGILIAAPGGAILRVNSCLAAIFGYGVDDMPGMSFLEISHVDDREAVSESVRVLMVGQESESMVETRAYAKGGRVIQLRAKAGLVRDADGKPQYLVAHIEDITDRTRAERRLSESETRYRRLFEAARDGILILDADSGRIVDVNPFMTDLTGYTRDEFLAEKIWDLGPFKDIAASRLSFAELKDKEYVRYDDLPLKTRGGNTVAVEFISNVYLVGDVKVIQCNIRDISDRMRIERENHRLVAAIEQSAESVVITDLNGVMEYVNPAFERVSGYARAEAVGSSSRILQSGAHDKAFYRDLWTTIVGGGTWRGRLVNRKKDGTLIMEDTSISPVRDLPGVIASYVAVKRDVTAVLAMEAQYLQAQKMEAVGRLAAGVAHDFNNLLSVILSYSAWIARELEPGHPLHSDIMEIEAAGRRAAALTNQLLAFSRQQVLQPRVFDLSTTVAGLEDMLRRLLGADIELGIVTSGGDCSVRADPGQIEQVVMNLVVNARDAMVDGGNLTLMTGHLDVTPGDGRATGSVLPGAYVELSVRDTGEGMTAATQARIYEPFFTTKAIGKGTGLGLATVFGIVKQSEGHIAVESAPGKGTTFRVLFPAANPQRPEGEPGAMDRPSNPEAPTLSRGTETILVVDDDESVKRVVVSILRRKGYTVLEAANAGEALLVCEQEDVAIDLLLTDVVLPKMNGRQLAERVAHLRPSMKVLYMSGYSNDMVLQKGIIESLVHFLQKPVTPATLCKKVREVLGPEANDE